MSEELLVDIRNHIAFVTLNRTQALNSLSYSMVKQFGGLLSEWETDDSVHAVLVRGAGEKAFCAGGDVRFIYDSYQSGSTEHLQFFCDEYKLDHQIHRFPKPYIALMDGIVMGGGMGIAQGAQFRIATDRTRMAMPETATGGSFSEGPHAGVNGTRVRGLVRYQKRSTDARPAVCAST